MTIPTISTLPTAPARTDPPATFISRADAFLAALVVMQGELNTSIGAMNADIAQVNTDATTASTAATNAAASAAAAQAASNATLWVSGTAYSAGDVVYSPTTFFSYRANTSFTSTTDPASDNVNWVPLTATGGAAAELVATGTISAAGVSVALRSDGTVEAISHTGNPEVIGAETSVSISDIGSTPISTYDDVNDCVVTVWRGGTYDGSKFPVYISKATISNGVLTYGTPILLSSVFSGGAGVGPYARIHGITTFRCSDDVNESRIAFMMLDQNNHLRIFFWNASGATLTGITSYIVDTTLTLGACNLVGMGTHKGLCVQFAIDYSSNESSITQINLTTAGGVTRGSDRQNASSNYQNNTGNNYLIWDGTAIIQVFGNNGSNRVFCQRHVPSGTTFPAANSVTVDTVYSVRNAVAYNSDDSSYMIYYNEGGNKPKAKIGLISGIDLDFTGSASVQYSNYSNYGTLQLYYDSTSGQFLSFYYASAQAPKLQKSTSSGRTISMEPETTIGTKNAQSHTVQASQNYFSHQRNTATSISYYDYRASTVATNAGDFIGFSQGSASDGGNVSVTVDYMVDSNQSGLTPKSVYYVDYDGSITTTETVYPVAGYALNSSTIQVSRT